MSKVTLIQKSDSETSNDLTISDLRKEVGNIFMGLKNKTIDVHDAATLAKLADTMISSAKVELDYNKFSNSPNKINFLEYKK